LLDALTTGAIWRVGSLLRSDRTAVRGQVIG
jgi:hypothetical protein